MSLKRLLYSLTLYLLFPFVLLRLLLRSRSNPAYRQRILERFGFATVAHNKPIIWVHAVSVGETIAAKPLIESLIETYPNHHILLTTTTPTGSDRADALFGDRVLHVYFPYDLLGSISRFMRHFKPQFLIVVETEIWPNLYASCRKRQIPLMIVNARLSEKSTQSYLKIKSLVEETLECVDMIAVRSESDAERFKSLGAKAKQVRIMGNIKYDISIDQNQVEQAKQRLREWEKVSKTPPKVWVAASTHEGEDEKIIELYCQLREQIPELLLVLVPRHPERFDDVFQRCEELKTNHMVVLRHSEHPNYEGKQANIILGDSMGEMQSWYACADVVFIGGSLVKTGGHNPLEATIFGVPVVSGPHMFNFDDIQQDLAGTELLFTCDNQQMLKQKIAHLLHNKEDFKPKADVFMQQHRGVTTRLLQAVSSFID